MKKTIYQNDELSKIVLDESGITGIEWTNDEIDLEVKIDWNGQYDLKDIFNEITTKLIFNWVTDLVIALNYKEQIKAPEITKFSFKKNLNNSYKINFSFHSNVNGHISFNCNSLHFEIIENNDTWNVGNASNQESSIPVDVLN